VSVVGSHLFTIKVPFGFVATDFGGCSCSILVTSWCWQESSRRLLRRVKCEGWRLDRLKSRHLGGFYVVYSTVYILTKRNIPDLAEPV
jgi:hypothetical protein